MGKKKKKKKKKKSDRVDGRGKKKARRLWGLDYWKAEVDGERAALQASLDAVKAHRLRLHYMIGRLVLKSIEMADGWAEVQGDGVVRNLVRQLGISRRTIYECMKFAKAIRENELDGLVGAGCPWKAIKWLMRVKNSEARRGFVKCWKAGAFKTVGELEKTVKEAIRPSKLLEDRRKLVAACRAGDRRFRQALKRVAGHPRTRG